MRIVVTGGNGSVGRELVPALLARGHAVAVLDRDVDALAAIRDARLTLVRGAVEDERALAEALPGAEAVVHLAWSFSEDPGALIDVDLRGHQRLLQRAREDGVRHVVYASTAVVYGKPLRLPIDEEHPLRVLEARKPAYGIAKECAEHLALLAGRSGGPAATILRFWWAFGETIPGKHLRELLRMASAGAPLAVPAECGGSFVTMDDLASTVLAALGDERSFGETFNVASAYVAWEEVARMAVQATASRSPVQVVPRSAWTGAAFLADAWQLDDGRLRRRLGWAPRLDPAAVRARLAAAIAETWRGMASDRTWTLDGGSRGHHA